MPPVFTSGGCSRGSGGTIRKGGRCEGSSNNKGNSTTSSDSRKHQKDGCPTILRVSSYYRYPGSP